MPYIIDSKNNGVRFPNICPFCEERKPDKSFIGTYSKATGLYPIPVVTVLTYNKYSMHYPICNLCFDKINLLKKISIYLKKGKKRGQKRTKKKSKKEKKRGKGVKKGSSLLLTHLMKLVIKKHMSRPLRIMYPDAWYHVMNRGRRGERIFESKEDYELFLWVMLEAVELFSLRVSAYCLMPNQTKRKGVKKRGQEQEQETRNKKRGQVCS